MNQTQKKIGILTYHRAINYGAFLQCYSLVSYVRELFPEYRVEVIDYETKEEYVVRIKRLLKYEGIKDYWAKIRMFKGFYHDLKKYLPLSSKRVVSSDGDIIKSHFEGEYEAIIVGSDAVWNSLDSRKVSNFFLVKCQTNKFSYAASLSGLNTNNLTTDVREELKKSLSEFKYIGVREEKGENFINKIDKSFSVYHNCDPTCFINLESFPDDIPSKLKKNKISLDKPIICLMTANTQVGKYVKEAYGATHQIVAIYTKNEYADTTLYDLSPSEFAVFFKHIDLMFSFYFHGCYLCMRNYKPVIAVDEGFEPDGEMTKINYLFQRLGIRDRYYTPRTMDENDYKAMVEKSRSFLGLDKDPVLVEAIEKETMNVLSFRDSVLDVLNNRS